MLINNRKELLDVFNKCGELARYHVEAGKECASRFEIEKAKQHSSIVDKYIEVRWDIIRILEEGSV